MPVTIGETTVEVQEPPPPAAAAESSRRQPPDMARIQAELKREAERRLRQWCD